MPKPYDLKILEQILEQPELEKSDLFDSVLIRSKQSSEKIAPNQNAEDDVLMRPLAKNPNYFLFMLGTDTVYTHLPTQDLQEPQKPTAYHNGETLSYMARVIADRFNEEPEIRAYESLSFSTPSVDVVNGPTTLGTEVGERIVQGVFFILKALSEGKSNIQISAHSRGAVESILIAHELERIKKAIQDDPGVSIFRILCDSPCHLTKMAFQKNFKEANESVNVRSALAQRLSVAKINMFLMDPVPGGSYRGLSWLAWRDERFYVKPPCTTAELFIFRDERTRCFKPIVPLGVTPILTPGHHGTASGNIYSQVLHPVPLDIEHRDTSSGQHLILGKLLAFINKATQIFDVPQKALDVQHPELDKVTNAFLNKDHKERAKFTLELYQKVQLNDPAFKHFGAKTSYAVLGREESSSHARLVHYGAPNSMGLDAVVAGLEGEFVNADHALLYLHDQMGFSLDGDETDLLITKFSNVLNKLFSGYTNGTDLKTKALLDKETDRRVTFQALSVFIDTISKKYLRNHLSLEVKTRLLAELDQTFEVLNKFRKEDANAPINTIINECEHILRLGIRNTAKIHYRGLKDQTNKLHKQLKYYLVSDEEFIPVFNDFLKAIEDNAREDNTTSVALKIIKERLLLINPVTIKSVRETLNQLVLELDTLEGGVEAKLILRKLVTSKINGIETYLVADLIEASEFLSQLDRLHENITTFVNGKNHIQILAGSTSLDLDMNKLNLYKDRVVKLAAEILIKKNIDLYIKPESMSDEFFAKVKRHAIALGASNPELLDLQKELGQFKQKLNDLEMEKEKHIQDKEIHKAVIIDLNKCLKSLKVNHAEAIAALNYEKNKIEQELQHNLEVVTDASEAEKARYELIISNLNEQLASLEKTSLSQISLLQKEIDVKELLYTEASDLQKTNFESSANAKDKKQHQKINNLKVDKEQQQKIIEQLLTSKELTCANFIDTKLIPLTQNYLDHLCCAAKKINPDFGITNYNEMSLYAGKEVNKERYLKIIKKLSATQSLLSSLTDTKTNPLPSARILKFTESITDTNNMLKEYRDSAWTKYFRTCMVLIGVVCSGILPGIIALMAYSHYKDKSYLFFNKSQGEQYVNDVNKVNNSLHSVFKEKSSTFFASDACNGAETLEELLQKNASVPSA